MDNFPDDECRTCSGILYSFNKTAANVDAHGNPKRPSEPICIGLTKTLPGRLNPAQLQAVDREMPGPFNGTVISVGTSQYCGYMVRTAKVPLCTAGFQVRIMKDSEDEVEGNVGRGKGREHKSLHDQVHGQGLGRSAPFPADGGSTAGTAMGNGTQKQSQMSNSSSSSGGGGSSANKVENFGNTMLRSCKRLWGGCLNLGTEMEKSMDTTDFGKKFLAQSKTIGASMGDTAARIQEGSKKLVKLAVESANQPPGAGADKGTGAGRGK